MRVAVAAKTEEEVPITSEGRILVMDDSEGIRKVTEAMLRKLGYDTVTCNDGDEAIEKYTMALASQQPFDAVILDLTMPGGMGGKETMQKLMEIDPRIKVIVSSGYSDDPLVAQHGDYGFSGSISKPFRIVELSQILYDVLIRRPIFSPKSGKRTK